MDKDRWPPNESRSTWHPGEEHYVREKIKPLPPFYRRHIWQILTCVLLGIVALLAFALVGLLKPQTQSPRLARVPPVQAVALPTSTPIVPTLAPKMSTYMVSVSASQDIPGVDTGIVLHEGLHIHITASGSATYGVDGFNYDACSSGVTPTTYPDGTRLWNGTPCPTIARGNGLTCPNTSVGMLCANFGQGWFYIGMSYDGIIPMNTTLSLIYSDVSGQYGNNSGTYQVSVAVE